jgi:hypothetical protein
MDGMGSELWLVTDLGVMSVGSSELIISAFP